MEVPGDPVGSEIKRLSELLCAVETRLPRQTLGADVPLLPR